MKYSAFLSSLTTFIPISSSYKCSSVNANLFKLGGYNVPVANYNNGIFSFEGGLEMVEHLWRREIPGKNGQSCKTEIFPSRSFNAVGATPLEGDEHFGFDTINGQYRGVGVLGGTDTEIDSDEGIYVHFGGFQIKEVKVGIRALFWEGIPAFFEKGLINLYHNGNRIGPQNWKFSSNGNDGDDGQESFNFTSEVPFDSISFITYSHSDLVNRTKGNDYFLEYLGLCIEEAPDTCGKDPKISGDPHVQTWSGMKYDFHGVCDLVMLQNPDYENGLGMDIHVRTKQIKEFSYISSAVLRIGDNTLEVTGGIGEHLCWIDQEPIETIGEGIIGDISGYPISHRIISSKQHEFVVDLGSNKSITMKTYKKFVHVSITGATKDNFGSSLGLLGSYGSGKMIARDKTTVLKDVNVFGQEWQVLPFEDKLFHNQEGPQAPTKCTIPQASSLRRRLVESDISEEQAKIACGHVSLEDFDICVFDVMATGDKDVVGAY